MIVSECDFGIKTLKKLDSVIKLENTVFGRQTFSKCLRVHSFFLTDTCSLIKVLFKFGLPHLFYLQS